MGKVSMMGSFKCKAGMDGEMEAVLMSMVAAARSEPGVEIYSYHRGEQGVFWFFALMADEESAEQHGRSEAMQEAMRAFVPLVAEPLRMSVTSPVAALGFEA